jgi:hypothetical protein
MNGDEEQRSREMKEGKQKGKKQSKIILYGKQ